MIFTILLLLFSVLYNLIAHPDIDTGSVNHIIIMARFNPLTAGAAYIWVLIFD